MCAAVVAADERTNAMTDKIRDAELIAAFLASKKVTLVEVGVRTMSNNDMKRAVGWEPTVVKTVEPEAKIYEVIDHAGRSFFHNEEGEWL